MIYRQKLELADNYWGFDGPVKKNGFKMERKPTRNIPYKNNFQNAVTFELDLGQTEYFRKVYTSLDFLSELGGLFSALGRLALLVISSLNYFGSFQFVMADNFYYRSGQAYKNDVQWNSLKSLRLNVHTFFPKELHICCFKPTKA